MVLRRDMGFWEIIRENVHNDQYGTSLIVIYAKFSGSVSAELLQQALKILFNRHPLLQARVLVSKNKYEFICDRQFSDIPCKNLLNYSVNDYQEIILQELNTPLETSAYLWRAVFNYRPQEFAELIFSFHHAIADGLSLSYLISEFIEYYALLANGHEVVINSLPLLDPIEKLLNKSISWSDYQKRLNSRQVITSEPWVYERFQPLGKRTPRFVFFRLEATQLLVLHEKCRAQQVTLNSVLSAALILAGHRNKIHQKTYSFLTLIDLKKYANPVVPNESLGCNVTSVLTHLEISETWDLWQLARQFQALLKQQINEQIFPPLGFTADDLQNFSISNPSGKVNPDAGTKFSIDFSLSNLGRVNLPQHHDGFTWGDFYFCTSRQAGDIGFMANAATLHESLFISFCYAEPLLSSETAQSLIAAFTKLIVN